MQRPIKDDFNIPFSPPSSELSSSRALLRFSALIALRSGL